MVSYFWPAAIPPDCRPLPALLRLAFAGELR